MIVFRDKEYRCHVELTLNLIGGKWKAIIIWELSKEPIRFNELLRRFPNVSRKMLTQQLKEMQRDGLVNRKDYQEKPLRVEYSLTDFGRSFMPVILSMDQWGEDYLKGRGAYYS